MCGIYGILDTSGNGFTHPDLDLFSQMAVVTQLRGLHNSGVFAVDKSVPTAPAKIIKTIGTSQNLVYERGFDKWWEFAYQKAGVIIGHGRHATVGKITKTNAHPFNHEHITMVHNGTIRSGLDKEHEADVDSHQLCKQMAADGIEEALKKAFGAFAVVVHDENDGVIKIVRNSERPLHYVETYNKIYIMSEGSALEYLYKRSTLMISGHVKEFTVDKVFIFDVKDKVLRQEGDVTKKTYPVVSYPSYTPSRHVSNVGNTPHLSGNSDTPKLEYENGDDIKFQVVKILDPLPNDKNYTYMGLDEDSRTVFFKTDSKQENLVNKWFTAPCASARLVPQNKLWIYQVRYREIKEDVEVDLPSKDSVVCVACGGTGLNSRGGKCHPCNGTGYLKSPQNEEEDLLLTHDGDVVEKSAWRALCQKSSCEICKNAVDIADNEETLVFESQGSVLKMICKHCLKENVTETTRGYHQLIQRVMS